MDIREFVIRIFNKLCEAVTVLNSVNSNLTNVVTSESVRRIVTLTQAEYDALETKDPNVEYNIIEA